MMKFFQRIIDLLRGKKKSSANRYGAGVDRGTADHAEATAVDRVRKATHPEYKGHFGKLVHRLVEGVRLVGGYPVIANDVGGYYNQTHRTVFIVTFNGTTKIEVWIHECAHYLEHMLGLIPPWHYPKWANLFIWWRDVPLPRATADAAVVIEKLPGCCEGDIVEVDFISGEHLVCQVVDEYMVELAA